MKNLIFLVILVIAGIVGYMYFFGKGEDREKAVAVVTETRELGKSVGEFLKRQKEKYDDGEFENLMNKIDRNLDKMRNNKTENTDEERQELKELERELRQVDADKLSPENRERLRQLLDEFEKELE